MIEKRIKMHVLYILIINYAKQQLIVVFSILPPLFHKLCVLELYERNAARQHFFLTMHTYVIDTGWGGQWERANFKKREPV